MPIQVESPVLNPIDPPLTTPRSVGAVIGLVSAFSQLVFTPFALETHSIWHARRVFKHLVELVTRAGCVRARLTVLQFLMRLRVDRDHRVYFAKDEYDKDGNIATLAALIGRAESGASTGLGMVEEQSRDDELKRARSRMVPQERDGRRASRGRGGQPRMEASRSRSRVPGRAMPSAIQKAKARDPLWMIPEVLSLSVAASDVASEGLMSYDPAQPSHTDSILQSSLYLTKLVEVIETEKEWEILSYVLCHLPTQLSNKHLFCGPRSKKVIGKLLTSLFNGISEGSLAKQVERWPDGIISRDAQGLAYHTLTVLISYRRCFESSQPLHHLVEIFLLGLSGQPPTQKCCLHALSLSAFELESSMTKYLSRIMEKLSQIMSNPAMAVHIIDFLAIVGSRPSLFVNFTENDYKMVFAVALKYLEHHNRRDGSLSISWTLSQHVRIMSYYIMYVWFLAVDMPSRKRHVQYIIRQLLLSNDGKGEVDAATEIAFDWLARYTYASADPRPAKSTLDEIVMNTGGQSKRHESTINEKTWILGNSIVTIRALEKRGWIEVMSRRASGLTKFLVRAENVPMVPLGDVDPDIISVSGMLVMDRENDGDEFADDGSQETIGHETVTLDDVKPLQLSAYPDSAPTNRGHLVTDRSKLATFFRTFDRMPVIDTHKVGVMYVAPGQEHETEILRNTHGSPAYTRFLKGLGRLIYLRGQVDVYDGGLDPDTDGEYAYAWWDDIGQILFHTATLMPNGDDPHCTSKKAHIGNDYVRIVWNDSGKPYKFGTLATEFQFVNIVIEPHSRGAIAAFSNNLHEHEYFKVTVQRAPKMVEFTPIGDFKLISATNLPLLVRQLSLLSDWFVTVWQRTDDVQRNEVVTNWGARLSAIQRFRDQVVTVDDTPEPEDGLAAQQRLRDFTTAY
uniref:Lid2 complex component lid2 n=1 Tax=Ganoderma boninense TaxID=34458 RepID=A0A5K1JWB1_9APHY|nr:Lid2 complex component lid2 [Ganoderma boninense]